ncbi:MAG: 23S rRNA (guanosine(2251)-2'-O)-methyltransferase RlmB [Clostridia bacterium]
MQIEGKNSVKESLTSNARISKLFVAKNAHDLQPIVDIARERNTRLEFVDRLEMDKMSETKHHQGLIAIVEDYAYTPLAEILSAQPISPNGKFILLLDGIEDPQNLGSIIRVAECAGVDGIVIPNRRAVGVNATVVKTSAGACQHIKIALVTNINDVIRTLKDKFYNVFCADMDGKELYSAHLGGGDIAIVIGGEGEGVKSLTRKLCDDALSIPQFGKVNSLNASVACGIVCYEVVRQRKAK